MAEKINVVIPTIGESVSEGTIGKWFVKEGDVVHKDQPLLEVDSDKATLEVTASATGRLKIIVPAGKTAAVGALVGVIESDGTGTTAKAPAAANTGISAAEIKTVLSSQPNPQNGAQAAAPLTKPAAPASSTSSSPAYASEELKGFGPSKRRAVRSGVLTPTPSIFGEGSQNVIRQPMSTIRKKIAQRLLESQQTTATLTTFNEVDMSAAMNARTQLKAEFEAKFGTKLGFMSFFAKAVTEALAQFPDVNARIEGDDIVYPQHVNLGIAVSTERGLVVPVLKNAQVLSYGELEKKIAELADRARSGKLQIPEMQGGTFTLTNGGVFGSLLSTPILNPPQSGILGMHKIEHRPIAIAKSEGGFSVEVRPMMYVALSYDHRIIDGATSVGFLVKVKEYLEKVTPQQVMA